MRWLLTILFLGIIMGVRAEYLGNLSIDGVDYNITASGGNSVLIGNVSLEGSDWNVSIMGGIDSSVLGNTDTLVYFGFLDNPTETEGGADTISPELVVTEPQSTNYSYPNISIDFEVSLDFSDCWYVLNDAPLQNISCISNTTFNATIGENNISINVNDTSNNINQSNITFEMYNETPIITFDSNTSTTTTISINFNTSIVANSSIDLSNGFDYPDTKNFNTTHYNTITGLNSGTLYFYNLTACTKTTLCSRIENLSVTTLSPSEEESAPAEVSGGGGGISYTNFSNVFSVNFTRASNTVLVNETSLFIIEITNSSGELSNLSVEYVSVEGLTDNVSIPVFYNASNNIHYFFFNVSDVGNYVFFAKFLDNNTDLSTVYEAKKNFVAVRPAYKKFSDYVSIIKEFVNDNKTAFVSILVVMLVIGGIVLWKNKGFRKGLKSEI